MIFPGGRVRKPIAGWKRMPGLGQDHHTVSGRWGWNHLHNFVLFISYDHDFCRHICLNFKVTCRDNGKDDPPWKEWTKDGSATVETTFTLLLSLVFLIF